MAEIDSFQDTQTQAQQSEYLKSINQSMLRLVDVNERGLNSTSQFFQGNSVQSTVSSLRTISQGAYDRFSDDLVSTRETVRSATGRAIDFTGTAQGTVQELGSHIPKIEPLAPIGATGFFGNTAAYSTNYRSTFWNDLWAGYLGDRAPQTMFQSDFTTMGQENIHARLSALNPLRLGANVLGVNTSLDEDVIAANMATSQRYTRFGTSRALSGVGTTRGEIIGVVEQERSKLLDKLGYNYDDFQAAKQIFAAGGQFIGTKSELERSHVAFESADVAEKLAKVLAVPLQDAARAMMDVRQQMGITSLAGQATFIQQTQALGMASGLSFQEAMGGALAGAGLARNLGFSVRTGGALGRDILASVNGAYLDRAIGENIIQSAGGVQNLSQNLANSAIQFATGPGSMYYLASMQGGQFNQQAFNQASGGFAQLGNMAASNASTIQGYANFVANIDNLQAQGGSFNAMAMQRSHLNNIFKSATGRDHDPGSIEDINMMKMLAASSGMFTDPTTAKAFVEMNFTEGGQESMWATQRDAYKAEKNLKYKTSLDQRFKGNSTDAMARSISNVWNKPVQALRGWFNDTFEDMGGRRAAEEQMMWATGQISLGRTTASDVDEFARSGGFSSDVSTEMRSKVDPFNTSPTSFARVATGIYEGGATGLQYGGAMGMAALAVPATLGLAGVTMMGVGALLSATGIGAVAGVPLMAAGSASLGLAGATVMPALSIGTMTSLAGLGAGMAGGGMYGLSGSYMTGGMPALTPEQIKINDKSVAAWRRGGGFSDAEKNAMGDPDTQKRVVKLLADKGLGAVSQISAENQNAVLEIIRSSASELGMTEEMVMDIAKTKLGVTGDPLFGADMINATTGVAMQQSGEALMNKLQGVFGDKFSSMINDSDFTSSFGRLLSAGGDTAERNMAAAKFLGSYGSSLSDEAKEKISKYVKTGGAEDREVLAAGLSARATNLRSIKIREDIGSMFGARAKDDSFANVADKFLDIANASSPSEQVGKVIRGLDDSEFRNAIGSDETLKRLLPLQSISRSDFLDQDTFKKKFGSRPAVDDLKQLQELFDRDGEQAVKANMAGRILSATAKSDPVVSKQNESQILADAAATIKDAAQILREMKR